MTWTKSYLWLLCESRNKKCAQYENCGRVFLTVNTQLAGEKLAVENKASYVIVKLWFKASHFSWLWLFCKSSHRFLFIDIFIKAMGFIELKSVLCVVVANCWQKVSHKHRYREYFPPHIWILWEGIVSYEALDSVKRVMSVRNGKRFVSSRFL